MGEQNSGDAAARLMIFGSTTTTRMTHLWIRWAEVAVDSESLSLAAKQQRDPQNLAAGLGREFSHGMVAVCAAVFAMEAITWALAPIVMPSTTVKRWHDRRRRSLATIEIMRQVLGNAIGGTIANPLVTRWETPLARRTEAVHFTGDSRPSVSYDGLNVSIEDADYSADAAAEAVELLLETLEAVTTTAKPAARQWGTGFRGQLDLLRQRRTITGE